MIILQYDINYCICRTYRDKIQSGQDNYNIYNT